MNDKRHRKWPLNLRVLALVVALALTLGSPGTRETLAGDKLDEGAQAIVDGLELTPVVGEYGGQIATMLFVWFGLFGEDPVEVALREIRQKLGELDRRIRQLESATATLSLQLVRTQNQHRLERVRDYSRQIQLLALDIGNPPSDQAGRKVLAGKAMILVDAFVDEADFESFWEWSAVTTDGRVLAAEFSPVPSLIVYQAALSAWVAALEVYSGGNSEVVRTYSPALKRHAQFMATLPGRTSERLDCGFWNVRYLADPPLTGLCAASPRCYDKISESWLDFPEITYPGDPGSINASCRALVDLNDSLGTAVSDAKTSIETQYGVPSMREWAELLDRYADLGRLREQLGYFKPSPYPFLPVPIYSIDSDGDLQWRRHKPLPQQPIDMQEKSREQPDAKIVPRGSRDPRFGTVPRISPVPERLPATTFDGPVPVGNGWGEFLGVFPAGGSAIYALTASGTLLWYQHDGSNDGTRAWTGPKPVGRDWGNFKRIFAGGDGVLYAIDQADRLLWYKHNGVASGGGIETWIGGWPIGNGWGSFKHVFSGGDGVIFAVQPNGDLRWYRHVGWQTGIEKWQVRPNPIGNEWADFDSLFSPGNGSIYGLKPDGSLVWYRYHSTWDPDSPFSNSRPEGQDHWVGPVAVATGLSGERNLFAPMPREASAVR